MDHATCPVCGEDTTIVAATPRGYAADPPPQAPTKTPVRRPKRPTRSELEQRILELERENARLRARK